MKDEIKIDAQIEKDIDLIKRTFAENDVLLLKIRSLLWGLPVSEEDKNVIRELFKNDDLIRIVKNKMFQEITDNIPLGQANDFWSGLDRVQGMPIDSAQQAIIIRTKVLRMLRNIPTVLKDPNLEITVYEPPADEMFYNWSTRPDCEILARNLYLKTIDTGLSYLKLIAGQKSETMEETKKRLFQNSSK